MADLSENRKKGGFFAAKILAAGMLLLVPLALPGCSGIDWRQSLENSARNAVGAACQRADRCYTGR